MLDLLLARYTSVRPGAVADRWVRAEHVRAQLGQLGGRRIADFIAADKWPGIPAGAQLGLHGHEVKVSRADWLAELRDPTKAEEFKRYMHRWWLVVPDRTIVRAGELPEGWGLMAQAGARLRVVVPAPKLTPAPLPLELAISLMAAAAKTAHREPLHRDAPTVGVGYDRVCAWCGTIAPCTTHQSRLALASSRREDD